MKITNSKRNLQFQFKQEFGNSALNTNLNDHGNLETKLRIWIQIENGKQSFQIELEVSILRTKAIFTEKRMTLFGFVFFQ